MRASLKSETVVPSLLAGTNTELRDLVVHGSPDVGVFAERPDGGLTFVSFEHADLGPWWWDLFYFQVSYVGEERPVDAAAVWKTCFASYVATLRGEAIPRSTGLLGGASWIPEQNPQIRRSVVQGLSGWRLDEPFFALDAHRAVSASQRVFSMSREPRGFLRSDSGPNINQLSFCEAQQIFAKALDDVSIASCDEAGRRVLTTSDLKIPKHFDLQPRLSSFPAAACALIATAHRNQWSPAERATFIERIESNPMISGRIGRRAWMEHQRLEGSYRKFLLQSPR